jgi:hypothetical protein
MDMVDVCVICGTHAVYCRVLVYCRGCYQTHTKICAESDSDRSAYETYWDAAEAEVDEAGQRLYLQYPHDRATFEAAAALRAVGGRAEAAEGETEAEPEPEPRLKPEPKGFCARTPVAVSTALVGGGVLRASGLRGSGITVQLPCFPPVHIRAFFLCRTPPA